MQSRIEGRIRFVNACVAQRCGPLDKLPAPTLVGHRWEFSELAFTVARRRCDRRMTPALAVSDSIALRPLIGKEEIAVLALNHQRTPLRGKNRNRDPSPEIRHTTPSYVRMRIARVCG
jgi:hypothetical protein